MNTLTLMPDLPCEWEFGHRDPTPDVASDCIVCLFVIAHTKGARMIDGKVRLM